jgi:hypothetical protein
MITDTTMTTMLTCITGLDRKGALEAIFQVAIASVMYSGVGHIIKLLIEVSY